MMSPKRAVLLKTLMTTTALGGALTLAAPALAADECGAPAGGVVTCAASGSPYGQITYLDQTNLKMNVDPGAEVGELLMIGSGAMELDADEGVSFSASAPGAIATAIELVSRGDSAKVAVNTVGAAGNDANGIKVSAVKDVDITAHTVTALGTAARGIEANSSAGDINIKVGTVEVTSSHAFGITVGISARAGAGKSVNIDAGSVVARKSLSSPNIAAGILVSAATQAMVKANNVEAYGRAAMGVGFTGASNYDGAVAVDIGRVIVDGENANGVTFGIGSTRGYFDTINAVVDEIQVGATGIGARIYGGASNTSAEWANDLDIGLITGLGSGVEADVDAGGSLRIRTETIDVAGTGIRVVARDSRTLIEAETIKTSGDNAPGIHVYDTEDVVVAAGSITTDGYLSHGLLVENVDKALLAAETISTTGNLSVGVRVLDTDEVALDIGQVTTTGNQSHGVTLAGGTVSGRIDSIVTEGAEARGLRINASNVDLEFGSIETFGNNATGVEASSDDGLVRLKGDSVITHGANARGVEFSSVMGGSLELGSVHTYGDGSDGVSASVGSGLTFAPSALGLLMLDIGHVRTEGAGALGVNLRNVLGEITGHVETIETLGEYSAGFYLSQDDGVTDVTLGSVTTHGESSVGVRVGMDKGDMAVFADSVATHGDYAYGVLFDMYAGSADLAFNTIVTEGEEAHGLAVQGSGGVGVVRANSITTTGLGAYGVVLAGEDAMRMTAELGAVTTSGDNANAVTTSWDGLGNNSEAVTVKAGVLTTSGANANGAYLYAQDLTLDIDRIVTTGAGSVGAFLANIVGDEETTTLRGRIGAIDTSGAQARGLVVEHTGRFDFQVDSVHTRGEQATGIDIDAIGESEAGGKLVAGAVLTEGEDATGVAVYSEYGGYDVAVQSIETRGLYSTGLTLSGSESSTIQLGSVRTSGDQADGVSARLNGLDADLTLTADDVRTTGVFARGVRARAQADVTLTLGYVDATGSESDAVVAESGGVLTLTASRRLGSASGLAADLTGDSIDVTLASTAVVEGGAGGLLLSSESGSIIRNAGSISSANGFAIEAEAGQVTLENSGLLTGRIAFSSADDVINNSGRFAAALTSNFSAGDDVFNNTGVLSLADPTSTTPRTAFFNNLERLNNAGIIDLANGVAGDVFTVSGMVNGQTANSVILDLDLRGGTPTADRIVAGGFEGLNHIVLNLQGDASLEQTGIIIAESGMAQTGAEMDVRVAEGGFIGYGVTFADGAYRLDAKLALPAFEPTKVATGAQHQWTSGADVVSARFEQMRDLGARPDGRGDQVWAQVYGGSNDIEAKRSFDLMGESIDADLSHEVKSQGVQAGVDRAVPVEDGSLVFGMLAGAGKTELRFQNGDVTEYDGLGVGAYGHWFSGPLSIGVLAKLDTFKLDYDWAEANLKTRSNGFTVGARVDAAWRIQAGQGWYVEPQASISWSDTALGRMKARDGAEVVFGDTRSVVGRIGVRAGAEMAVGDGLSFKPYAAVHALNEFEGDNASTLLLGDEAVGVTDRAHGAWGRAVLGASLDAPSGLGGFIQAEGDFGEVEGFTARAGVKFSW